MLSEGCLLRRKSNAFLVSYIPVFIREAWSIGVYYFARWLRRYVLSSKAPILFLESVLRNGPLTRCNPILIVKELRNIIPRKLTIVKN